MTITFRVEDGRAILAPMAAIITPDQLASLRDLLAEQSLRLGFAMLLPGYGVTGDPWFEFDAAQPVAFPPPVTRCRSFRSIANELPKSPV